mgnify:CR=1 FL=1
MITDEALQEAIMWCLEDPAPDSKTCLKLAAYLTIRDRLYPDAPSGTSGGPQSEFRALADKLQRDRLMDVLDGLMTALEAINPKLYDTTIDKMKKARS